MRTLSFYAWMGLLLAGPVEGAGFLKKQDSGQPYQWDFSAPLSYSTDCGSLGAATNAEAIQMAEDSFQAWKDVTIATLDFDTNPPPLINGACPAGDITASNIGTYVTYDSNTDTFTQSDARTLIIFDNDGTIMNSLFGGIDPCDLFEPRDCILGVASPTGFNSGTGKITKGFAIINGYHPSTTSPDALKLMRATFQHELGHLLNLTHTQLGFDLFVSNLFSGVPTMLPVISISGALELQTLHRDDEFSIGYVYPDTIDYNARGFITGSVKRKDATSVRGVNIYCRNVADPSIEAVSWVSDQDGTDDGDFICGNLPNGATQIELESIFVAINDFSPSPPFVAKEFFNGAQESSDPDIDDRTQASSVVVATGSTSTGAHLIINEDGRLVSSQTFTGSAEGDNIFDSTLPDLPNMITVPSRASRLTIEIQALEDVELILAGKCDQEISTISSNSADFDFIEISSNQRISKVLSSTSSPALGACTYHLTVFNISNGNPFNPQPAKFSMIAIIDGVSPTFTVNQGTASTVSDGVGDLIVASVLVSGRDDLFRMQSLSFKDIGNGDLSRVTSAKLFEDTNNNGAFDAGDRLVADAASLDVASRLATFNDFFELVPENTSRGYLLVYNATAASAGWGILGIFMLVGVLMSFTRSRSLVFILMILSVGSCGSSIVQGFAPRVLNENSVGVTGQGFGSQIAVNVEGAEYDSVADFFN